jgi:hypothetical protein
VDVHEFREEFLNEAAAWAASERDFKHSSFLDVAVRYLEEAEEVADFEAIYYRGVGANRKALAIDGFAFDDADDSLKVFVAEPSLTDETPTLTFTDAKTHFGRLGAFLEQSMSGLADSIEISSPAHGLVTEIAARWDTLTKVRAYLLTDALLSSKVRDWPEGKVRNVPVEYHIWDIGRFHRAFSSRTGRDDLVVDFSGHPGGGVPCLEAGTDTHEYGAYLCVVPATLLADLYEEHGSRLLEGNVRSFLAVRGKVNKGIRNTLLHSPEMFFAYNNGIAATASSVVTTAAGDRITTAADLQIVNGGQTTASLASARKNDKADLSSVYVQMKLSVVSPERSGEMIPMISRFANSQNRVSEADFFSNHEFHRRLEEISRRLWVPAQGGAQHETHWFYERTRGQYVNETALLTPARKRNFEQLNPRTQVLTKTDLAKAENAWRQLPHVVSRGAQKNFLDFATYVTGRWDADSAQFHEEYWRTVVGRTIMFRATEKLVTSQDWYAGGYRANVVAYAIAGLSRLVDRRGAGLTADFGHIWRTQALPPGMRAQLVTLAKTMHDVITQPHPTVQNVTEWSKRELCWTEARQRVDELDIAPLFADELIDLSSSRHREREARSLQKVDSGIDAQTTVIMLGEGYWRGVEAWINTNYSVSPEDLRLVRLAGSLGAGLPSDRQSSRLLDLKSRLELEGMAPVEEGERPN